MPGTGMIKSVLKEYGVGWIINRSLYSTKLKVMRLVPATERFFEKKTGYPKRLDLFQIDVKELQLFICGLAESDRNRLIETADKICEGIITGFSSIELNYGNPIDWQLNPLTNQRCNEKLKWYRIPDFDYERGDIKAVWEASRFSHFITLARAYLLTENKKYYRAFSNQLKWWLEQNPYSFGANFKCGQECSLRMVNGLLTYSVFHESGIASDADTDNMKELIDRCYRKVLSNFFYAHKCIKNNHTISELVGMIAGAWCCDDQKQMNKAYRLLEEVVDEQFTDDGGYSQFSFNYQRLALQDLECVLAVEGRTGKSLSDESKTKIKNAAMLLYQCQDECGDVPNYGANDGALVFPVTSGGYRDYRSVINTVYALTANKQLYKEGKQQEELLWFSGGRIFPPIEQIGRQSSQFRKAGLFTYRNQDAWMMIVLNDYKSRPAHMDQLHIDLWIEGVNVLCDGGTYSYAEEPGKELVSNMSHNTAMVQGVKQMKMSGPFMLYDWTKRKLGRCDKNHFEGIVFSDNGYRHKRKLEQRNGVYILADEVDKDFAILFHTQCEVSITERKAVLSLNGAAVCTIESSGEMEIKKSKRSLYYLKQEETNCIAIKGIARESIITKININSCKKII